jgi:hypothetical protein
MECQEKMGLEWAPNGDSYPSKSRENVGTTPALRLPNDPACAQHTVYNKLLQAGDLRCTANQGPRSKAQLQGHNSAIQSCQSHQAAALPWYTEPGIGQDASI